MIVAAGFIATAASWVHFEDSWNELLRQYEIPYLQMSALHARKKPFHEKRWNNPGYMAAFLSDAGRIIRSHATAFSAAGVKIKDFEDVCEKYELSQKFNAYALCGTSALLDMKRWLNLNKPLHTDVEFFVEEGDEGVGQIQQAFRDKGLNEPIRRPGKPQPGKGHYVQFQACDWLAFETRKFVRSDLRKIRICHAKMLADVPGRAQEWTIPNLINFCKNKGIQERC